MDKELMGKTVRAMIAKGKGLLAADESAGTCEKRFASQNIPCTEETRRTYRELLFTAPGMEESISGVILFDETIRQKTHDGIPFAEYLAGKGVVPGIKVDKGAKALAFFPGEQVTEGLDGLRDRLKEYFQAGARFAKWRAVINIGSGIPTETCINANSHALARYAALCQEADIVPVVEPEVLLDGEHSIERCYEVTEAALGSLFNELRRQKVSNEHVILKASMVLSGNKAQNRAGVPQVAEETVKCLKRSVPATLPGVVFLSGGQTDLDATAHLDAINRIGGAPWPLTFSYSRALQAAALRTWAGNPGNAKSAQQAFLHRARMASLASLGRWAPELEKISSYCFFLVLIIMS
ncbi:MAG TPA: fructose-bisphosphate aldolase class I [Lentisphaeria bacterium]|nr:MAG: fructose-bisphosphate aldolase [Lentisphaerae bacterium GWF2_50_93]HCE44454.1 fructose-bisphosphate aldolase class I [Lentisphaeria bacterium]